MRDIYFVQTVDNSRLVRVADPRRAVEIRLILGSLAFMFLLLFGYAWQKYQIVRYGYQTEDLRQKNAALMQWNQALTLEQASLRDPIRIYAVAERNLGLRTTAPGQVLSLDDNAAGADRGPVLAEVRTAAEPVSGSIAGNVSGN
jgi:cell division protein FtsL